MSSNGPSPHPSAVAAPAFGRVQRPVLGLFLGFLGICAFGGTLPFTKLALESFSPAFVTFGRASVAGAIAACVLLALRRRFPRGRAPALIIAAVALVFAFPGLSSLAMMTVPANHGGVMLSVTPLAITAFAVLMASERPSPLFWFWSVAGGVVVATFALGEAEGGPGIGHLWLLLASISTAFGYVIFGKLSRDMPGWEVICWALVLALPVSVAGAALSWRPEFMDATGSALVGFGYTALFSMFLGFFAWNAALAMGGIARVGQVQLLQVFVTLALSAAILNETLDLRTFVYAALVVAIVWFGRRAKVR
jgi:drug/metabolite transporter (DMT)-like permease